jgi:DNA primase
MTPIDEIKARINIVDFIQRYVPLKKAGRTWKACCPFHSEKTPSFVVNEDRQTWRCFGACATGGDIFGFAMKQHGWTFSEALHELGKMAGVEVREQSPERKAENERLDRLRGIVKTLADYYHERLIDSNDGAARSVRAYVRSKRGLAQETIDRFTIGFAPDGWSTALDLLTGMGYSENDLVDAGVVTRNEQGRVYDRFRNRLVIPIRDERGRVVGFGARALDPNDNAKYLNSPQSLLFDKSRLLFGLDLASRAIRDTETAVIVEGYMDVIQAHQAGYTNVVAQMGTALTETQLKLIAPRWAKTIILALDADAAGQNATMRSLDVARTALKEDLAGRLSVDMRVLSIPDAKDPDDFIRESPQAWGELVSRAIPVADFVIHAEAESLPANASLQQREAVARRLLPILLAAESDLYRKDNLQKLALKLHIAERDMLAWAAEQQRVNAARPPRPVYPPPALGSEPPPLDYEALEAADGLPGTNRRTPPTKPKEAAAEEYFLRKLYEHPDLFYEINRKFYELADGDEALEQGLLGDISPDDFSSDIHRVFMAVFRAAIEQVDMDPADYVRAELDDDLFGRLLALRVDEPDYARAKLVGDRHRGDFSDSWKRHASRGTYSTIDWKQQLVVDALQLRVERIKQELQELRFIQMETSDEETMAAYALQTQRYLIARSRLEQEIRRMVQIAR